MSLGMLPSALLIPPLNLLPLAVGGALLALRWPRLGRCVLAVALAGLWLLALPVVAFALLRPLEDNLPLNPSPDHPPRAIVILSASGQFGDRGGIIEGYDVGLFTLERVRAGALLGRHTGLPILVSGGVLGRGQPSIADAMAKTLADSMATPVRWIEGRSIDTIENARMTAEILRKDGIDSIYLVTNGWHMRRSVMAFRDAGFHVTAAPSVIDTDTNDRIDQMVPQMSGWDASYIALHEWIGIAVYMLRR